MEHGPVDVMVIAFGEPKFQGKVLVELERLAAAGTIRVLDATLLVKELDGTYGKIEMDDLPADVRAALGFVELGTKGLFDAADESTLLEGMVPGSGVLALAIEHAWAAKLVGAFYDAGAEVAMTFRVPAVVVDEAFAALAESKN